MRNRLKSAMKTINNEERGYILISVIVLMLLISLIIPPFLGFMATGAKTGTVFETNTNELYAANSGIEDAMWKIKYDHLSTIFADYSPYDFNSSWNYNLPEKVNDYTVNATIQNYWIPKDMTPPSESDAERIIKGVGLKSPKVMITGTSLDASTYKIKIQYYPDAGEQLKIDTIGVWLPTGFTYVEGSSSLEAEPYNFTPVVEPWAGGQAITWNCASYPFAGYDSNGDGDCYDFGDRYAFPDVNRAGNPMVSTLTFQFSGPSGLTPEAISWVDTNLDLTQGGSEPITYTWDTDLKVYKIISVAGGTEVEAYIPKSEMRTIGSPIPGDYVAVGNSLMARSSYYNRYRDILLSETSATADDIPSDAYVAMAYLYWSGWFEEGAQTNIWGPDDCSDFTAPIMDWTAGSAWDIGSSWSWGTYFRGNAYGKSSSDRYLTMNSSIDLSSYAGEAVKISWQQWEDGYLESEDAIEFQFSGDGGNTWSGLITAFSDDIGNSPQGFTYTIPDNYLTSNFKMRFHLEYFGGSDEYVYIDNIAIVQNELVADTTATFKINGQQVYFDAQGNPQQGFQEIIVDPSNRDDRVQVIDNSSYGNPHGYSYSSRKDVTALVREFSDGGNATYTVGSVDATWDARDEWAYAGWSLVIIYASAQTEGHQVYLYDDFLYKDHDGTYLDFDKDGKEGGSISNFIVPKPVDGEVNAARITAFVGEGDVWYSGDYLEFNGSKLDDGTSGGLNNVWNGESAGMSAEGVDVDTFYIPWSSGLLEPGDTSAEINIWTENDVWNLTYIILSFRSETTTGGCLGFMVH
ncbi:hypothetical protein ACFLTQ_02415 [Chloroflexota bacterium]